jgi:hypothetical protein
VGGFKISTDDVIKLVRSLDRQFISEETIDNRRIISVKCNKCGNEWKTPLNAMKNGKGCKKCFDLENRVNRQKVVDLVESNGYKLLTPGEFGVKTRFKLHCTIHQYEWESCYWNLKYTDNGGTCHLCSTNAVKHDQLEAFIISKNGVFVKRTGTTKKNPRSIVIRCNVHNKEFKTRWGDLQRGRWCRSCAIDSMITTHKQIKDIVESKGGVLLTPSCSTATMLFRVRCCVPDCGREWETSYARIQSGCWCPKCAGFDKYTVEEVKELVLERGGTLLDTEITNAHQKIAIRCGCSNLFSVEISNMVRGSWCQVCSEGYKVQVELFNLVKDLLPNYDVLYDQYPFNWLRDKQRLELDIWVPELRLAIEYDGEQHFRPIKFAKTMTDEQIQLAFETTQRHDQLKDTLIAQHPEDIKHFIRIKYDELITKEHLIERLKAVGYDA